MEVEKRFPELKWSQRPTLPLTEVAGREIYIFDPDGFPIQLIAVEFNAWGDVKEPQMTGPPLAPAMSINHLHIEVSDLKRSIEFYSAVYGAKPAGNAPGLQTLVLPSAHPGFGSWISLSQGRVDKEGKYDRTDGRPGHLSHVGYGVKIPNSEFPKLAEKVKQRFPDLQKPNTPITQQAGQEIYIFDPDGLPMQLIAVNYNSW
jgi:catechol 2,3-dioxygenase-like lactoylglutathione lyase family enzyme